TSPLHTTAPTTQTPNYEFDGPNGPVFDSLAKQTSYLSLGDHSARTHYGNPAGFPIHTREDYLRAMIQRLAQTQAPVHELQDHVQELVSLLYAMGGHERLGEAEHYMLELLRMHEEVFGRVSQEALADMVTLAEIAEKWGKLSQAENWHRKIVSLATTSFGERSETTLGYNFGLLKFLWRSEQSSEEVKPLLRDLLKRMLGAQGPYSQSTVECQLLLAEVLGEEDEWSEAKDLLLKAVSTLETVTGCDKKIHCEALLQLVEAYCALEDNEEAERVARRALGKLQYSSLDDKDIQLQSRRARRLLADSLEGQDSYDQSIRVLEQLLDGIDQHDSPDMEKYDLTRPQILLSIGIQHYYQSNLDEAESALKKALQSREYDTLESNNERFEVLYYLAKVMVGKQDFNEAESLVQRSIAIANIDKAEHSHISATRSELPSDDPSILNATALLKTVEEAPGIAKPNGGLKASSSDFTYTPPGRDYSTNSRSKTSYTTPLYSLSDSDSDDYIGYPAQPVTKTTGLYGKSTARSSGATCDLDDCNCGLPKSKVNKPEPAGKPEPVSKVSKSTCDIEGCNCGLPKSKIDKPEPASKATKSTCDIEGCNCGLPKSKIGKPEPTSRPKPSGKVSKSTCDIEGCKCGLPRSTVDKPKSTPKATRQTCDVKGCTCGLPPSSVVTSSQPKTSASTYDSYLPYDSDSSDDIDSPTETSAITFDSLKPAREALKDIKLSLKCLGIKYTTETTDEPGQTFYSGHYNDEMLRLSSFTHTPNEVRLLITLESESTVKEFQQNMRLCLAPMLLKKRMTSIFITRASSSQESVDMIRDSLIICDSRIESTEGPPRDRVFYCQLKLKKLLRATSKVDAMVRHQELLNNRNRVEVSFTLVDGDQLAFEEAVDRILSSVREVLDEDIVD
ncbi:unnamed protein product, partial [Fusarium langsethiae]